MKREKKSFRKITFRSVFRMPNPVKERYSVRPEIEVKHKWQTNVYPDYEEMSLRAEMLKNLVFIDFQFSQILNEHTLHC